MTERTRVIVWCEDREHELFVRRLLEKLGVDRRCMTFHIAPRGRGSAAEWVLAQYRNVRDKAQAVRHQARLGFLIVVDGDASGFLGRQKQLSHRGGQRDEAERIGVWIPTWSIETWVLWLCGSAVSETTPFKNACDFRSLIGKAIDAWATPLNDEATTVPSLAAARRELSRLPLS